MRFRLLGRGMGRTYGRQRIQRLEARAASRAYSLRGLRGRLRCPIHGVEPCTLLGRDYLLLHLLPRSRSLHSGPLLCRKLC